MPPPPPRSRPRVLSGVQPSGDLHLGNYLGAFRNWVADQHDHDALYCIVDLHALTLDHDPAVLADKTLDVARWLLAAGLDPGTCTLFVQSHVPEHTELCWLLECTATFGELRRMTQFKDKSGGQESVRVGLFTYPVLMAADILVYDADRVPVGDDQRQHLELARNVAQRFNSRYGETFVVPDAAIPRVGARVMDLQEPTSKMSKSTGTDAGLVYLADDPAVIERKIKRAVTDSGADVVFDPVNRPGLANLIQLLAAATGREPADVAAGYTQYGPLKADAAAAVVEMLRPAQERYRELASEPGELTAILAEGAARARQVASATVARAREAMGLLPPRRD
ncbi:MAG TPA: tryptophan--tRNA ligase [Acidimicrobiales bacterium]|nr:tryptophan--tRNA ligase [Acidimicrobiales bacterium]